MNKDTSISVQFLEGFFDRMSDVIRYSGTKVLNKENLAEHSYYVSVLSDSIAEDIEHRYTITIDRYKVLKYALYHDIEEIFTGDIISPVKYKSNDLRMKLEKVWNLILTEQVEEHFEWNPHIARMILQTHKDYEEKKYTDIENMIVKFADTLQAISYTISELHLGNTYLKWITHNAIEILKNTFWENKYFSLYVGEIEKFVKENIKK